MIFYLTLNTYLNLPEPNLEDYRFMLCGSPSMLKELTNMLDAQNFKEAKQGHYAIEWAFVEK